MIYDRTYDTVPVVSQVLLTYDTCNFTATESRKRHLPRRHFVTFLP